MRKLIAIVVLGAVGVLWAQTEQRINPQFSNSDIAHVAATAYMCGKLDGSVSMATALADKLGLNIDKALQDVKELRRSVDETCTAVNELRSLSQQ